MNRAFYLDYICARCPSVWNNNGGGGGGVGILLE